MKLAAVNLKSYFGHRAALNWCRTVADRVVADGLLDDRLDLLICPAATELAAASDPLRAAGIRLGGQFGNGQADGAHTGSTSMDVLAELGATAVVVGHAERRREFAEDDAQIAAQLRRAVDAGLVPLLCVGEIDRGPAVRAADLVAVQIDAVTDQLGAPVVIAYEPVWAIGATEAASPDHVNEVCRRLRPDLRHSDSRIIYGGTAGPGSWAPLGGVVDGLFLGRRVHDPCDLLAVLREMRSDPSNDCPHRAEDEGS
ncbi:MAG: triosephosphate isomerase [Gemmatimonadetes bacterium]|nr:triosephosphate isomerase [Gemmatimonadota bacterium]MYG78150.1 triosephosphate isomerase [Acidimicrobiaceae bacterium]